VRRTIEPTDLPLFGLNPINPSPSVADVGSEPQHPIDANLNPTSLQSVAIAPNNNLSIEPPSLLRQIFPSIPSFSNPSPSVATSNPSPSVAASSVVGSSPAQTPNVTNQVSTLLDLLNQETGNIPLTSGGQQQAPPPVTILNPAVAQASGGTNYTWIIVLGALGLIVALGVHYKWFGKLLKFDK